MHRNRVSLCIKRQTGGRPAWLNRDLYLELRDKKGEFVTFGRRDKPCRRRKRLLRGYTGRKIRRAKTQLEINLTTAIIDNKNVSINTSATKGLRRTSISNLHWMQGKI